jgi:hypothetical protein
VTWLISASVQALADYVLVCRLVYRLPILFPMPHRSQEMRVAGIPLWEPEAAGRMHRLQMGHAICDCHSNKRDVAMKTIYASPYERPVALLSGLLLATLLASGAALAATKGTHASIIAMSQKLKNDAVSITYAYLPKDGSLAVYPVGSSGKMEKTAAGTVKLTAGDHRDVSVSLSPAPKAGEKFEAVILQSGQPLKYSSDAAERTFKIL